MNWEYLLIAYAAVGVVVWLKITVMLFGVFSGELPEGAPKKLSEEIHDTMHDINNYQSPTLWLIVALMIVGILALFLVRYVVTWPITVYKWRKRGNNPRQIQP